jgi:GMP synthase-like glutamine amidotransferase
MAALPPITPINATCWALAALQAKSRTERQIKWRIVKRVAIFRASSTEGPGYFATYLERRSIEWRLVKLDAGDAVPRDARKFAGLAFMGGPMSANDELPWIIPALELVRDAVHKDVPVLGHCLGGQLMARALGGAVSVNRVKEIGWGEVRVADNEVAREWLGKPGATRVMHNAHCENQAFALGRHFGMQCHVEMTPELIDTWIATGADEIAGSRSSPAVQEPAEIRREMAPRLTALNQVANRIYDRWTEGISRGN